MIKNEIFKGSKFTLSHRVSEPGNQDSNTNLSPSFISYIWMSLKIHFSSYSYAEETPFGNVLHSHNLQGKKSLGRNILILFSLRTDSFETTATKNAI